MLPTLSTHTPNAFTVAVALVEPTLGQDEDGGPTETFEVPTEYPLTCFINTMDARTVFIGDTPQSLTPARVFFRERPDCNRGHRIIRQSDGREFRVMSPPEERGGTIYLVNCELID